MAIHKMEVEWHDLIEDPNDVPEEDMDVYVIVDHNNVKHIDEENYIYSNGEWRILAMPSEDDPMPVEYESVRENYPWLKIVAWCKPLEVYSR